VSTKRAGQRSSYWITHLVGSVAAGLLVAGGMLLAPGRVTWAWIGLTGTIGLAFTWMGALVLAGEPRHLVGRLMTSAGVVAGAGAVAASWTVWAPAAWLAQWLWSVSYGLIVLALLVFPDGHLSSRPRRIVAAVILTATALAATGFAIASLEPPHMLLTAADPPDSAWAGLALRGAAVAMLLLAVGLVAVIGELWRRWHRAAGEARRQVACLLLAAGLLVPITILDTLGVPGAWLVLAATVPAAMTLAVLRFRLYHLDRLINRTFVWLIMSVLVVAGFVIIVALLRDVALHLDTSTASLAATAIVAVIFEPVRGRVQRTVNHILYGDRDNPYQVVSRLAEVAGRTAEHLAILPLLAETLAHSLQLPYVEIEAGTHGEARVLARHGVPTPDLEAFDMLAHGERVGRLLVAPRSYGGRFTHHERRLLTDVALHAASAVKASQLVRELQRSRERLVIAREEERRRLRRDLHDGLGPAIAGMSMQVRAIHHLVSGNHKAERLLDGLAGDLTSCMAEVRQLVDQLRPPVLDGGLAAALRAECHRFGGPDLKITLTIDEDPVSLPAAVEVAAYRIVAEALTNVARHARATTCHVKLRAVTERSLAVEITDDGIGMGSGVPAGVGLLSMRERAEELGGTYATRHVTPHGTSIDVTLPLPPGPAVDGAVA